MKRFVAVGVCFVLFILSVKSSFAASVSLQSTTNSLSPSDEYEVNATLSIGSSNGTQYYLRGAFYLSGTNNYCGFTWNGSSYYNGPYTTNNGWTNLLPIVINNSSWSGTLKAKLDTTDSGCSSSGTYNFKIERFTSSGTGTFDTQNEQILTITVPTPTPSPAPTATPVLPTNTPVPSPTQKLLPTATIKPTLATTPFVTFSPELATLDAVLGSSTSAPAKIAGESIKKENTINFFALFLILGGMLLLSSCGILLFYQWKKANETESSNE